MRRRNWLNSTRTTGEEGRAEDLRENTDNYATIIFDNDREDSAFKTINLIGQGTREDKDEMMNILT
jgi:hypothetical protein